jgi:hypothetical protein
MLPKIDRHTRQAARGALAQLAVTPISRLTGKRLDAEDFDKLMIEDTPRDLLVWMNSPSEIQEQWDGRYRFHGPHSCLCPGLGFSQAEP